MTNAVLNRATVTIVLSEQYSTLSPYVHYSPVFTVDNSGNLFYVRVAGKIASKYASGPNMLRHSEIIVQELRKQLEMKLSDKVYVGYLGCHATLFQDQNKVA